MFVSHEPINYFTKCTGIAMLRCTDKIPGSYEKTINRVSRDLFIGVNITLAMTKIHLYLIKAVVIVFP